MARIHSLTVFFSILLLFSIAIGYADLPSVDMGGISESTLPIVVIGQQTASGTCCASCDNIWSGINNFTGTVYMTTCLLQNGSSCFSSGGSGTVADVWVNESGDSMTGNLNMTGHNITNIEYLSGNSPIHIISNVIIENGNITAVDFKGSGKYLTDINSTNTSIYSINATYSNNSNFSTYSTNASVANLSLRTPCTGTDILYGNGSCGTPYYNITNPSKFINQTNLTNWQYLNSSNTTFIANTVQNSTIARISNCSSGYVLQNVTNSTTGQCVLLPTGFNESWANLTYVTYENPVRNLTWTDKNESINKIVLHGEIKDANTLSRVFFENGVLVSES